MFTKKGKLNLWPLILFVLLYFVVKILGFIGFLRLPSFFLKFFSFERFLFIFAWYAFIYMLIPVSWYRPKNRDDLEKKLKIVPFLCVCIVLSCIYFFLRFLVLDGHIQIFISSKPILDYPFNFFEEILLGMVIYFVISVLYWIILREVDD